MGDTQKFRSTIFITQLLFSLYYRYITHYYCYISREKLNPSYNVHREKYHSLLSRKAITQFIFLFLSNNFLQQRIYSW